MADKALITESYLTGTANAIREKLKTSETYLPSEMPAAIRSIPTADSVPAEGAVAGVKGNAETDYRNGYVNLTPGNIGVNAGNVPYEASGTYASGTVGAAIGTVSANIDTVSAEVKKQALIVDCGSFSSLPRTVSNASITADMVVIKSDLSDPAAATANDWKATTSAGSLTISGSISGTTSLTLYLSRSY